MTTNNVNFKVKNGLDAVGTVSGLDLVSTASSGNEGGEIRLATAATGSTLTAGTVTIDVYQNKLRIFETGGTARGAYIDLSAATASVGSNLLAAGGGGSGVSLTPSTTQIIQAANATTTPLALRPFATSPTADIFAVQNSAGAFAYFKVSAAGAVTATTLTTTTHTFSTQNGGTVTTEGGSAVVNGGIIRSYQATLGSPVQAAGGDTLTIFGNKDIDTDWNAITVKNFSGSTVASISSFGDVSATSISKIGGTSTQYLMADGSVTTGGGSGGFVDYQALTFLYR